MRLNLQVNHKNSCQQSNSVSNAAALFSPHRCRVTIFAGVLPAALPSHPHRGLRFGALPQSMFGATVTAHLSGLCVAQWEVPANCAVSSSTSMAMFGRSPAARGTSRFWGEATKTKGPRLKQEPLRTGRIGSSRALPASCGRRRGSFLPTSPGTSSQSRKTALRPSGAPRPAQPLSARSLRAQLASWPGSVCACQNYIRTDVNINNNGNNASAKRPWMQVKKASAEHNPWVLWSQKGYTRAYQRTYTSCITHSLWVSLFGINHPNIM